MYRCTSCGFLRHSVYLEGGAAPFRSGDRPSYGPLDRWKRDTSVRYKILVPRYVIEPIALCVSNTRDSMRSGMALRAIQRRPGGRAAAVREPANTPFVSEKQHLLQALGAGSVSGAAR